MGNKKLLYVTFNERNIYTFEKDRSSVIIYYNFQIKFKYKLGSLYQPQSNGYLNSELP